jgi:hypothetical protein
VGPPLAAGAAPQLAQACGETAVAAGATEDEGLAAALTAVLAGCSWTSRTGCSIVVLLKEVFYLQNYRVKVIQLLSAAARFWQPPQG